MQNRGRRPDSKAGKARKRVKDLKLREADKKVRGGIKFGGVDGESTDKDHKDWSVLP